MVSSNTRMISSNSSRHSESSSPSKAIKYFVACGIPIVLVQLLSVYKFMLSPTTATKTLPVGELSTDQSIINTNNNNNQASRGDPEKAGDFNGYPIYYQEVQDHDFVVSQVHCIGESYQPLQKIKRRGKEWITDLSWMSRSCHFHFFCYDMNEKEYTIFQDPSEEKQISFPQHSDVSQAYLTEHQTQEAEKEYPYGVAIGGINRKWTHEGIPRVKWYPKIRKDPPKSFYVLPKDVVLIPFHSLASFNPGHLVWDDFLPLYTLMQIFSLDHLKLLAMRYILQGDGLWASCDWRVERTEDCEFMLKKFGSLMVSNPKVLPFTSQKSPRVELLSPKKSNLVCARHGLAGMGSLTDHGVKKGHGWETSDYKITHNSGRGGQLWKFRNFMLGNLGLSVTEAPPTTKPLKIIFSEASSNAAYRNFNWSQYIKALEAADLDVVIEKYMFKDYSLKEQAEIIGQAAIFVTASGGGAVTATFLPRGASVVLFYGSDTGLNNGRKSFTPARLDFDYFNNMAYLRCHWIGQTKRLSMQLRGEARDSDTREAIRENQARIKEEEVQGVVTLIKHDLSLIRKERIQWDEIH